MAYTEDAEDAYKKQDDEEETEATVDPYIEYILAKAGVEPSASTPQDISANPLESTPTTTASDYQTSDVGGVPVTSYGPESGKEFVAKTYGSRGEAYQNAVDYANFLYGDNPNLSINVFGKENPGDTDWAGAALAGRMPYTAALFPKSYGGFYDAPGASVLDLLTGGGESINLGSLNPSTAQHELTHAMFPRVERDYNAAMGNAARDVAATKTLMPDTAQGQQGSLHPSTVGAYDAAQALRYYAVTNPAAVQSLLGLAASQHGSPSNLESAYSEPVAYLADPGIAGGTYDGRRYVSDLPSNQQQNALTWLAMARDYARGKGR